MEAMLIERSPVSYRSLSTALPRRSLVDGLIGNPQSVSHISELGVVLLLFIIGLELSPRRLWVMRKSVFGVGLAQVLLTGSVIGVLALYAFGQPLNSGFPALYLRCGCWRVGLADHCVSVWNGIGRMRPADRRPAGSAAHAGSPILIPSSSSRSS